MIENFLLQLKLNNLEFEEVTDELIRVKNFITQDELNAITSAIGKPTTCLVLLIFAS